MTTYYRADFASGHVEVRSTENRKYVACVVGFYDGKYARAHASWVGRVDLLDNAVSGVKNAKRHEVSEAVVEITAQEYRSIKKAS